MWFECVHLSESKKVVGSATEQNEQLQYFRHRPSRGLGQGESPSLLPERAGGGVEMGEVLGGYLFITLPL